MKQTITIDKDVTITITMSAEEYNDFKDSKLAADLQEYVVESNAHKNWWKIPEGSQVLIVK